MELHSQIDTILQKRTDPLGVLKTTAPVVENARFVNIHMDKLDQLAKEILTQYTSHKHHDIKTHYGRHKNSLQKVFFLDVANFCFWNEKNQDRWFVEYPVGSRHRGWNALVAAFDRAIHKKISILDAEYLATISKEDIRQIFQGENNTQIPLLDKRLFNLQEAGRVLLEKYHGEFENLLKKANHDALKIMELINQDFSSFNDTRMLDGNVVNLYKRTQILVYDISLLPDVAIKNLEHLTIFADYKLPQVFRSYEVLEYSDDLAQKIDSLLLIPEGSQGEIEIRAATVWIGELLADKTHLPAYTIDNIVWLMGKENEESRKPYHRTYTTAY